MRNDCTVGKLSERNEADDEEAICRRNRSCMSRVGVVQPRLELYVWSRSRKWTVPLRYINGFRCSFVGVVLSDAECCFPRCLEAPDINSV